MIKLIRHVAQTTAFITLLLVSGCYSSKKLIINDFGRDEDILCTGRPSYITPSEAKVGLQGLENYGGYWFHIHFYSRNQLTSPSETAPGADPVAKLEVQPPDRGKPVQLISDRLKAGSTFTFKGITWQVSQMGRNGVVVQGDEWCRTGFMHIKQIKP